MKIYSATGGELQAILDEDEKLNETQTRICMQQVLKALQYLHKKYIAHLDLKPQNILLTGTKVEGKYSFKSNLFVNVLPPITQRCGMKIIN